MPATVSVTIDTEEDNWGAFVADGATVRNIAHLIELQDVFGEYGARPTYLVNRPPLLDADSVDVLGRLAGTGGVEIGAHCHPWNTPPDTGQGEANSMMFRFPADVVGAMIGEVRDRIRSELGVVPTSFRAGRWGWGSSVAHGLAQEGFRVDCSVTPLIDWSSMGGADFSDAPELPFRFHPDHPLVPDPTGPLIEVPTTIGFLRGSGQRLGPLRRRLERATIRHLGALGALDRLGLLARRWLSPEVATGREMVRLARNVVARGRTHLDLTFHSCTLLPGVTPFVRDVDDRRRFLDRIRTFLAHAVEAGYVFRTIGDVGADFAKKG